MKKKKRVWIVLFICILLFKIFSAEAENKKIIKGTLTEARKEYIVVNGHKYLVTDKTIIADTEHPKTGFFYSLKLFSHPWPVRIVIKGNVVEKILIEVPK